MSDSRVAVRRDECGIALIVTVLLLLMISAIGLSALGTAQDESMGSGSTRRKISTMYAADSMLNLVLAQLASWNARYPNISPIDQPKLIELSQGFPISGRTGTMDSSIPQPIQRVGETAPSGYQLNMGSSNSFSYGVYRVGVVASDTGGGNTQLQAQYRVAEGSVGY